MIPLVSAAGGMVAGGFMVLLFMFSMVEKVSTNAAGLDALKQQYRDDKAAHSLHEQRCADDRAELRAQVDRMKELCAK